MLTPLELAHSSGVSTGARMKGQRFGESKPVEKFVMSVIEEAATSSPCTSSPPSPTITRLSQHSQEVIEEALGSLANLIISSAVTNSSVSGAHPNPLNSAVTTSIKNAKSRKATKKEHQRQNLLLRKQSSLKALTPEDLGRLMKSATYASTTSQTYLTNASTNTEVSTVTISHTDHLSTFHLRKPISSYRQNDISDDVRKGHTNHNAAKVLTRDQRSKSSCAAEGKSKEDSNDGYYSADNNTVGKIFPQSQSRPHTEEAQSHKKLMIPSPPTNKSSQNIDENQNPVGDDDNMRCHGHMCIHHHHHHSHHYHHHYYHPLNDDEEQQEDLEEKESVENQQGNLPNDGVDKVEKKFANHKQLLVQPPPPPPPPPQLLEHPQDMSFYRKFSATSPITRSKSSLAWPATNKGTTTTGLNVLSLWTKSKKSRSTPIKLDMISEPISLPPISLMHYSSSMCGGCFYCSKDELSCNCCCDECCCARQFSKVIENKGSAGKPGNSSSARKSSPENETRKFSSRNRSRSMDSFIDKGKDDDDDDYDIEIDDEILDSDAFIDTHLLRHLEESDSEEDINDEKAIHDNGPHSSTIAITKHIHCDCDKVGQTQTQHLLTNSKSYPNLATNEFLSADENIGNGDEDNESPDNDTINLNKNGLGAEKSLEISKSTNIVFTRKPPTGPSFPSTHRSGRRRSTLRIANGEIRSSPTSSARPVTTTISSGTQHHQHTPSRNDEDNSRFVDSRNTTSAVMTVTVDTMSLFLDAVHVQI